MRENKNKDYETAIEHLERVKKLTDLKGKEKVALKIETLQDLIYEQVKRANTLEDYEAFVAKYPDNPKNSDEARRLIAKMKPQESSMGEFPEMQGDMLPDPTQRTTQPWEEVFVPEPMESRVPVASAPVRRESIEIVAETKQSVDEEEFFEETLEETLNERLEPVMEEAPPKSSSAMERPQRTEPVEEPVPTKRVRITTQNAPLRVRAKPDARSKVVSQIPKNSVVPVYQETKQWFQIKYQKGKKGWISKKYSRLVN